MQPILHGKPSYFLKDIHTVIFQSANLNCQLGGRHYIRPKESVDTRDLGLGRQTTTTDCGTSYDGTAKVPRKPKGATSTPIWWVREVRPAFYSPKH